MPSRRARTMLRLPGESATRAEQLYYPLVRPSRVPPTSVTVEVQVGNPNGPTTFFAVRNTSDQTTVANFSFYSRLGPLDEPLRTDVHTLGPRQTKTVNVASDLTGLEVTDGFATGLILITEAGNPSAPNLEGDFFRLDTDNAFATGDRLIRPAELCLNQEIRFVDFGSGSQLRILLDQPQGPSLPSFAYSAYMENGDLIVQDEFFTSDHLTTIDVVDLGIDPAFGTVVFDFSSSGGDSSAPSTRLSACSPSSWARRVAIEDADPALTARPWSRAPPSLAVRTTPG